MTVSQMIKALESIEDKDQECYFDVTPKLSTYYVFRSIDIIEIVTTEDEEPCVAFSCGLEDLSQIFLN